MTELGQKDNENKYSHVSSLTGIIIESSYKAKQWWIDQGEFVGYEKAKKTLDELERIYQKYVPPSEELFMELKKNGFKSSEIESNSSDIEGLSIIGDTGSGKTFIIDQFEKMHIDKDKNQYIRNKKIYQQYPIARCILQDAKTGIKGLYPEMLRPFLSEIAITNLTTSNVYKSFSDVKIDLHSKIVHYLINTKVKLFFIDEFQHVRRKNNQKKKNNQEVINQLKQILNLTKTPFVLVGTKTVLDIIYEDDQLSDRCPAKEYSTLDYWNYDNRFRGFLKAYESVLPFPESSNLHSKTISKIIFEKVKFNTEPHAELTNLRNLVKYIKKIALNTLNLNLPSITEDIIEKTPHFDRSRPKIQESNEYKK